MIYIIRENRNCRFTEDRVKIGFTKGNTLEDAADRLKQLQTGNSNELTLIYGIHDNNTLGLTEGTIHKLLEGSRVRGEWFSYNDGVKDFIQFVNDHNKVRLEVKTKVEVLGENDKIEVTTSRDYDKDRPQPWLSDETNN